MAILKLAAEPPPQRTGFMLKKRLLRIVIAVVVFLASFSVLLARDGRVRRVLPFHREHTTPDNYQFTSTSRFSPTTVDDAATASNKELCASFPKYMLNVVQPVLKVGHSENQERLAAHFNTTSSCFTKDELLVVSDLDEVVHGHRAVDILGDLPASYYDLHKNRDFQSYLLQKEMRKNGTLNEQTQGTIDGWILDKYKFLPMVERAWLERPGKAFYFFYEPDTYVFWDNAFRFLQSFDPDTPIYMGSPSPGKHDESRDVKTWFANGGPGIVLSRGAIKALLHRRVDPNGHYVDPPLTEKWQDLVSGECCGDSVLGWALWNVTVQVQGYWPMFNPHPLHGIPFSDLYWCQPVLTLHKTSPQDMHSLWRWEFSQRTLHRPMVYADVWCLQHPGEPSVLENWDNGDWDRWDPPAEAPVNTFETCEQYCRRQDRCVQWTWRGGDEKKCILMSSIRYGTARTPAFMDDGDKRETIPQEALGKKTNRKWVDYKSGWVETRIKEWRDQRKCQQVHWVGPSVSRIF
ncbi:hypothetical protein C2857_004098 [Epichloe festucae Fl1]|uniref:N-acetylgalactosaminide beta-1,3-galactosyltransferase n=1 Tax=Epichloe festucae (strain Fl1) TaxID=877507 RepID=A0A7S9KKZ7_EPIFF|nr:hypothetical protein C2857_004098 [Epichloe festucae Fl1]